MLSGNDIRGVWAIIPTPSTPDANRMDAKNTVELAETERLVNALIDDGVDAIITTGTTGECATITDTEFRAFADCVARTVKRRVPLFIGATALGGHAVAERLAVVRDAGADGTLLGLPMWQPCTTDMAVKYYREVAEMFPELAIMVYANTGAFRFDFPIEFWGAVGREVPSVVAAKQMHAHGLNELIAVTNRRVNFLPIVSRAHAFFEISPETTIASWATQAGMGPAPAVAMMRALRDRDQGAIDKVAHDLAWAGESLRPINSKPELFAQYNIQIEKIRMDEAGYCRPGPMRPPYDVIPPEYEKAARECGRRWAELHRRYSN
jgi:dihydrodipicolinate synthase/N-acetylneuraminate lyase